MDLYVGNMSQVVAGIFSGGKYIHFDQFLLVFLVVIFVKFASSGQHANSRTESFYHTTRICIDMGKAALRARHKSCFLRPDTGPCRADIIQFYFDAMAQTCYRFFWGGCQGNGNRFEDRQSCMDYCYLNMSNPRLHIPHFCNYAFDYGTCFGQYNRWTWDKFTKSCRRRMYSGCGGNQNNFETRNECMSNCMTPPNNTLFQVSKYTTCIPITLRDLQ